MEMKSGNHDIKPSNTCTTGRSWGGALARWCTEHWSASRAPRWPGIGSLLVLTPTRSRCTSLSTKSTSWRRCSKPNIISCTAVWVDDPNMKVNFIMELFSSGILANYYKLHRKHVKMDTVKSWVRQIRCGLKYLHTRKPPIVHRDIKCDIFINGNTGKLKIEDMGFAKEMREASLDRILGTPKFMAPEILDRDYNLLVDVYALGMRVLEMITKEYPYKYCESTCEIFMKVRARKYSDLLQKISNPQARACIMRYVESIVRK
uniref:non-specific serine/threonine protein kinase n=1 Tax=Physcomitrium patens TaxID=3218 RepID=A0A2K1KJF7_PHYPA|nr:hypothetical protein PHYPA_007577 [Physcomitrium patens]